MPSGEYHFEPGHGGSPLGSSIASEPPPAILWRSHSPVADAEFADLPLGLQSELTTLLGFELDDEATDGSVALTPWEAPVPSCR